MTTAMATLETLQAYPALGYIAAAVIGGCIVALLAAVVAWMVRP